MLGSLTPLFTPSLYLALALVLAGFARRQRDVLAILVAGVAFELSLLLTAASADYAQSCWMIASTCLAAAMLVARRARR